MLTDPLPGINSVYDGGLGPAPERMASTRSTWRASPWVEAGAGAAFTNRPARRAKVVEVVKIFMANARYGS